MHLLFTLEVTHLLRLNNNMKFLSYLNWIFLFSLFTFMFLFKHPLNAETSPTNSMNDIQLHQFGDFKRNWNFVTVRYRKDSKEMRFTYANDLAWQSLKNNKTDYPDGSIFAKIGIASEDDPSFPSSAVPSGKRRIQFMVKDAEKYKETNGWGYALFDWNGQVFPGDLKKTSIACASCHQIVQDRGYVFSQLIGDPLIKKIEFDAWKTNNKFLKIARKNLSAQIKSHIPKKFSNVFILDGTLSENLFWGTLDEVRPLLSKQAAETNTPALLVSKDGKHFSLVLTEKSALCPTGEVGLVSFHTVADSEKPIFKSNFCYDNK